MTLRRIWPDEAIAEPLVWTALAWGGRRDLALMKRLSGAENLQRLVDDERIDSREGIIRGAIEHPEILQRHILETDDFPEGTLLKLSVGDLPAIRTPRCIVVPIWRLLTCRNC